MADVNINWASARAFWAKSLMSFPHLLLNCCLGYLTRNCQQTSPCLASLIAETSVLITLAAKDDRRTTVIAFGHVLRIPSAFLSEIRLGVNNFSKATVLPGKQRSWCRISESTPFELLVRTSVGTWLSLVEHSLGVRGVGSSNLPVPTKQFSPSANVRAIEDILCPPPRRASYLDRDNRHL